ncbi:hypothetical protein, partial [Rhizobium leguminosarum]|uniref:hypothetical protein n=1 Tax=Rhizobium leguminosarum TaxID=384 RepID=UPI003F9A6433
RKSNLKNKLIWTIVVITGIAIQQLSEPLLIKFSYSIVVKKNESNLLKICDILKNKSSTLYWVQDPKLWKRNSISEDEGNAIKELIV